MRLNLTAWTIAVLSTVLVETPAFADSCSEWKNTCTISGPAADGDKNLRKCTAAADECRVQCKKGNKVFVGPFNGAHHPVTSCK